MISRWREAGGDPDSLPPAIRERLPGVFAASNFVFESATREPGIISGLAASGELDRARTAGETEAGASAVAAGHGDEPAFMDALRRFRRHELVRIAWRDLAGRATLDETLRELSALADASIRAALDFAVRALAPRYGTPRSAAGEAQELVVIGMGKLGGGELNFSSDVDLIFLYPERRRDRRSARGLERGVLHAPRPVPDPAARRAHRRGIRVPRGHAPAAARRTGPARDELRARSRTTCSSTAATGSATPG